MAVLFNRTLALLILGNLVAFVLESIPSLREHATGKHIFYAIEAVSSALFLLEYTARLWVCTEAKRYRAFSSPTLGRLRYAVTFTALVDLASFAPFFIELVAEEALPTLTWLKALRIFRVLKTERCANVPLVCPLVCLPAPRVPPCVPPRVPACPRNTHTRARA